MKIQHTLAVLVLTLSSGLALAATTNAPQPPTSSDVVTVPANPGTPGHAAQLPPNAQKALKQHQAATQNGTAQNMNPSAKPGTAPQTPSGSAQGY